MLAASETVGARVKQVAANTWDVVSWPETDLAADLGWDITALTGLLIGIKFLWIGLHHENKARPFRSR